MNMGLICVLFLMLAAKVSSGSVCPKGWFNCGNGICLADIWRCDGENDCGNFKDEQNCGNYTFLTKCGIRVGIFDFSNIAS
ncbi:hypothetical protein AVEN_112921-1 [Araneus ventricosus]|uniref:Uncharacterized protein n=1 Tax=Araneus ventricosus TaxID=182803 RepID=A0A4Y2JNC8_ARAVE|nr:hypothetical protein AVEN_112921-1 [Araneus ventricosus]